MEMVAHLDTMVVMDMVTEMVMETETKMAALLDMAMEKDMVTNLVTEEVMNMEAHLDMATEVMAMIKGSKDMIAKESGQLY
jgi:hypothetical protein